MNKYILTKTNKIFFVWSDNEDECTYDVFPDDQYDITVDVPLTFSYDEVRAVDNNLALLLLLHKQDPVEDVLTAEEYEDMCEDFLSALSENGYA